METGLDQGLDLRMDLGMDKGIDTSTVLGKDLGLDVSMELGIYPGLVLGPRSHTYDPARPALPQSFMLQ